MNTTTTINYRVIAVTIIGDSNKELLKWEGTDIDQLSMEYPPSEILFADPLGHSEIEGGYIRTDYRFERQLEDCSWEEIDDPRRRLTPVTDFERAIDAENRRLFPGDYGLADDDDCGCRQRGCPVCDPEDFDDFSSGPDCTNCDDHGCATCQPYDVCRICKTFLPGYLIDGVCQGCEWEASRRFCIDCNNELQEAEKGDLCANCEFDRKTKCSDCQYNLPNGADGLCSICREYNATPFCIDCKEPHTDPTKVDGDLCETCDTYWTKFYNSYDAWWRRVLRKCKIMK
jgi:hypothetical protein